MYNESAILKKSIERLNESHAEMLLALIEKDIIIKKLKATIAEVDNVVKAHEFTDDIKILILSRQLKDLAVRYERD